MASDDRRGEAEFAAAVAHLVSQLGPRGPLRVARVDSKTARPRGAALEVAGDLVAFSEILLDVHVAAVAFETEQVAMLTSPDPPPRPLSFVRRLHAAYRAFFFLSRQYQDHLYCLLLMTCPGCKLSRDSSMNDAVNRNNPVRQLLDERVPDYWEWFDRWRELRNRLKEGVSVILIGPPENIGICFDVPGGPREGRHEVRLADATAALTFSTAVTETAIEMLAEVYGP